MTATTGKSRAGGEAGQSGLDRQGCVPARSRASRPKRRRSWRLGQMSLVSTPVFTRLKSVQILSSYFNSNSAVPSVNLLIWSRQPRRTINNTTHPLRVPDITLWIERTSHTHFYETSFYRTRNRRLEHLLKPPWLADLTRPRITTQPLAVTTAHHAWNSAYEGH